MSNKFMPCLALPVLLMTVVSNTALSADQPTTKIPTSNLASQNFWLLNRALNQYQSATTQPLDPVPGDPYLLKPGKKGPVVLLLREHLRMTGDLRPENDTGSKYFDSRLAQAVKTFQATHGLKPDGVVGDETRVELNVPPEVRVQQIALNMQRWADLSAKMGDRFILVNIPDFHMYLFDDHQRVLSLRAIVGKPDLPTPEITSKITRIEFNPQWNIPNKIAMNDIIPKILDDPGYLYRMHIRVYRDDTGNHPINPSYVDWYGAEANGFPYHLRQDSGPDDALGLVKFEFANTHDVYMHDTPAKNLFAQNTRGFSHGCIRLENPFALVSYLMKDDPHWNEERLQEILDTHEPYYVKVPRPIPIFVTYITVWVDEDGHVNFRNDVYQQDDNPIENPAAEEPSPFD